MSDSREKRVELILQQLEELPALPEVAVRVLEVTAGDSASVQSFVNLIAGDAALSARILQVVRRSAMGARGEPDSIEAAVASLGFEALRSAVLAVGVFQVLGNSQSNGRFSREEFWKHCVAVACCAELLAEAASGAAKSPADVLNPAEAFICGLLHDLGKLGLDAVLPKSFARAVEAADLLRGNIADLERTIIGLDHLVVGKRLAERWQLPSVIRDCTWLHGQHPQALPATVKHPRMINLISLADLLVREQHLGYSGNYTFTVAREPMLESVGLTPEQVEEAMSRLVDQIEPRARALGLGQASSGELYQQALAQANRELGRVSGQLASRNRRMAVRAKFFDALSNFQCELRPDAPPLTVLQAIAQTGVSVLGVKCVAAFSLPPGQDFAETVLCNEAGEVFDHTLIDLPGMSMVTAGAQIAHEPSPQPQQQAQPAGPSPLQDIAGARPESRVPGDGPVMPVGDELEWLVGAISPRLTDEGRYWICLEADGACIGGVVWGAAVGEAQRLSAQVQELAAIANGWALSLRTAQIREEARTLAEQLADSNRQLHDAQNEILRSKMMISVGEMAAGAAHEMNNPLAVISGRSQLLATQLSDAKHKAAAHLIHEQAHRLSAIISELMDFAKPEPPAPREVELAELVGQALHEAKMHTDPADREIEVTMGDVPPVLVDPQQVSAALREVIENALHATDPADGHVAVHAAFDPYSSRVVLTVTDNGCGMDENTVKRAFDPFFSNKPAGRRRGMGLAKALRWLEASGGSIRLESRPGHGTRSILLLPATNDDLPEKKAPERKLAQG